MLRLLQAVYQCVAAHSELLCYFIIVLNHMVTASATSLVLPVLVFLWAMLSIPRPSKRFWMTAIVFTEVGSGLGGGGVVLAPPAMLSPAAPQVMVVTKYLFQFGFFPWNSHMVLRRYENKPYFPPRILGLEKTDGYIKYDLVQLLALFFHRSQLLVSARCQGRWAASGHLSAILFQEAKLDTVGLRVGLAILPGPRVARTATPAPQGPPSFLPQCYGLWDHEEDPLSKEPDGGQGKEEPEEEPALLGLQTAESTGPQEELGAAGATAEDDIQVEVRDGPSEPHVEIRPHDTKRISLRFRRRRKEMAEPKGPAAIGTCPCQSATPPAHPALTWELPPQPEDAAPGAHCWWCRGGGLCLACWSVKWGDGSPSGGSRDGRSWTRPQSIRGDSSPIEAETEDEEQEAAAASRGQKRWSRHRERVRAVGIWLQTFCLSL